MKLSELTVDLIREAYAKTGCKPGKTHSHGPEKNVCPLEAVARFKHLGHWSRVLENDNERYGFYQGYDGTPCNEFSDPQAYAYGRQVRDMMLTKKTAREP